MTIEELFIKEIDEIKGTQESKETQKVEVDDQKREISKALTKRRYDIYDKKVYLNKRTSHVIAFGYLRNEQDELDIDLPYDLLKIMFKFYYIDHVKQLLRPLPPIQDGQTESMEIFIEKLQLCETTLDFAVENMETTYENAKQRKTKLLNEITEFIASKTCLSDNTLPELINMISSNLFRVLPHYISPYINSLSFINDDEKDLSDLSYSDASWSHLELIYDILWRLINIVNAQLMQKHLTYKFLSNLVNLFSSRQQEERQYVMMILHKIYGRSMQLRPIILEIISNYLYKNVIHDNNNNIHYGISELLQIISVVMSGLKVPVKLKWREFLTTVLVPLYKSYALKMFWEPLTQCCLTYISKDINAANIILAGLLKYWPIHSPQKEEIFIMVTNNIINALISNNNFIYDNHKNIFKKVFNKLSECMLSQRQTVAQRATDLLKERPIQELIDIDRRSLLSIIVTALYNKQLTEKNDKISDIKYWKNIKEIESIYKSLDRKYWKTMTKYLNRQHKKEIRSSNSIGELKMKGEDEPWIVIKQKRDEKYAYRPPPELTSSEKLAKRKYCWAQIQKMAEANKIRFKS